MVKNIPELLHLCITDNCQLQCKHCYFGNYKRTRELTIEEILLVNNKFFELRNKFLNHGYKYKDPSLNISGGEPLLHKKIIKIVNILPQYYSRVKLLTNGLYISEYIIKSLLQNSKHLVYQISLDGTKEAHEYIRGKGTFDKTVDNIKKLKDLFPELHIQISFNINNKNNGTLLELVPFVKKLGASSILIDRYVPFNNGQLKIISREDFKEYDKLLNNLYDLYNDKSFIVHRYKPLQNDMIEPCGACIKNQICYTNGDRFACTRYHIKTGNWFTDSVDMLFESSIKYYNKLLVTPDECSNCVYKDTCNGGMRCISYSVTKKHNIKDIHCFKYREK